MSILKRLFWPLLTCLLLSYPALFLDDLLKDLKTGVAAQLSFAFRHGVGIGLWLAGAWLLNSLVHVAIWDRLARPVPALLKHLVGLGIFLLAATGIAGYVFGQSVTGVWATSGVVGLVFGFAARSLIADLFSGIAMHLDPPFRIGDWIEWREGNEEVLARVEQMNWRSTRVHVRDDTKTIFIPNSHLATISVTNVFAPHGRTRQIIRVPLDPAVDLERATRVLLAGVLAAEGPLEEPQPDVLLEGISQEGLIFQIRYWHDPEASIAKVRHAVLYSALETLDHAGIRTARNRHDVLWAPMPAEKAEPKDARWILRRVEIFQAFSSDEIDAIADQAMRLELPAATNVVRQGDPGDSLYFVMEGLLDVWIEVGPKPGRRVGKLQQGNYFGEMSLLTGDPRSATVVATTSVVLYEISKSVLEPILAARPAVARQLAETVARRQRANLSSMQRDASQQQGLDESSFAQQILTRIRSFFGT